MSRLRVFFEQRLVGTIDVDKTGASFIYDPDWIALRGAFPHLDDDAVEIGAHCPQHFRSLGSEPASGE